jgi:Biopolymer transport protein ExbD/TolR
MKSVVEMFLFAFAITCVAGAQQPSKPALQQGISVEMPVANHAVEMRAADEDSATIVSVAADGNVFVGVESVDVASLSSLKQGVVYVKADAQVPYQKLLTVLDVLQGRTVVLLTAPAKMKNANIVSPYGVKLTLANQ